MAYPFRAPRTITEMMQMQDAAEALRSAGRVDAADAVEAAVRSVSFDPESVAVSRLLQRFNPQISPEPRLALNSLDEMPAPEPVSFPGYAGGTPYDKSNRSFMGIESGRTMNLRNQNTDLNRIRQDNILTAAQDSIRGQQDAATSEALARKLAAAAMVGGGLMAGESLTRGYNAGPTEAGSGSELPPPDDLPPDVNIPDVDMLPPDDPIITNDLVPASIPEPIPEEFALLEDDPMATADLAEESRPIPASTPRVQTAAEAAAKFSADAQAQIARLNAYRRSGQITPDVDRQMSAEINRMLQLANEARSGR